MMKSLLFAFCATTSLVALDTKPWLGDVYAFSFESGFSYAHFPKVQGASTQLRSPENSRNLVADVGLTTSPNWDVQLEGEFGQANSINWALRSGAMQIRFLFLNDVVGDLCSFICGVSVRGASSHFLKSVSTPYAAECNIELSSALGKEWSLGPNWTARTYGFLAVGQANRGSPWIRPLLVAEYNLLNQHRFTLFSNADVGFGGKQGVDVDHFHGWSPFQHQSVDLGVSYGCELGVYGRLTASYARRLFAHNFPERMNLFTLSYFLPFSLF